MRLFGRFRWSADNKGKSPQGPKSTLSDYSCGISCKSLRFRSPPSRVLLLTMLREYAAEQSGRRIQMQLLRGR